MCVYIYIYPSVLKCGNWKSHVNGGSYWSIIYALPSWHGDTLFFSLDSPKKHENCLPSPCIFDRNPHLQLRISDIRYQLNHFSRFHRHQSRFKPSSPARIIKAQGPSWEPKRLPSQSHPARCDVVADLPPVVKCYWNRGPSTNGNRVFKDPNMGISMNMGTPKWMIYFVENHIYKWMIWGYSDFRKPPYEKIFRGSLFVADWLIMMPFSLFQAQKIDHS